LPLPRNPVSTVTGIMCRAGALSTPVPIVIAARSFHDARPAGKRCNSDRHSLRAKRSHLVQGALRRI
jgi:hypothetical protein